MCILCDLLCIAVAASRYNVKKESCDRDVTEHVQSAFSSPAPPLVSTLLSSGNVLSVPWTLLSQWNMIVLRTVVLYVGLYLRSLH